MSREMEEYLDYQRELQRRDEYEDEMVLEAEYGPVCASSAPNELRRSLQALMEIYWQDMRGAGRSAKDIEAVLAPSRQTLEA